MNPQRLLHHVMSALFLTGRDYILKSDAYSLSFCHTFFSTAIGFLLLLQPDPDFDIVMTPICPCSVFQGRNRIREDDQAAHEGDAVDDAELIHQANNLMMESFLLNTMDWQQIGSLFLVSAQSSLPGLIYSLRLMFRIVRNGYFDRLSLSSMPQQHGEWKDWASSHKQ